MAGVRHQAVSAEVLGEDPLAGRDRFLARHLAEARLAPGLLAAFDDERRGLGLELVGVRPHPTVRRLLEDEGEGVVELLPRAEPDELAFAQVDVGLEGSGEGRPRPGVQPVSRDHQVVGRHVGLGIVDFGLEGQLDAQFAGTALQEEQQALAADAAETMAGRQGALPAVDHRDIVPIGEVLANPSGALGIVGREIVQRLGREHDSPAERVVRPVALEHGDLVCRVTALHGNREIEAGGTGTQNSYFHRRSPPPQC